MAPATMSKSGWALIEARTTRSVEFVPICRPPNSATARNVSGICLGVTRSATPTRCGAAVAGRLAHRRRYDAVDVPALTRRQGR